MAYTVIFILNCISFLIGAISFLDYLIPLFLVILPIAAGVRINFSLDKNHFMTGLYVSSAILLPYILSEVYGGRTFATPPIQILAYQLLVVSIPEEIFFRGFLQQSLGNNYKGILITSLLFSFAHLPVFLVNNDIYHLLTFFPSIALGFLYMKTNNIMPCIMFHLLSNILWEGFR